MPELNIAPPTSASSPIAPMAPTTAPTGPATTDTTELPDESFAAMLMAKVAASLKSTSSPAEAAALPADAVPATVPAQDDGEVPIDAIALLAPLLPGIATSMPTMRSETPRDDEKVLPEMETEAAAAPALGADLAGIAPQLAAPIAPAAAGAPTKPAANDLSAAVPQLNIAPERSGPGVPTAAIAAPDIPTTANLAAEKLTPALIDGGATADKNATAPQPQSQFDTLLANAHGDMASAQHSIASHMPATAAPARVTTEIATPVGTHGWDSAVGEKITWMVGRQETRAELVLNPPQLGRIEVSLSMNGDQTNAIFVSANPAVREALENAVPRLREMLQDAGISLGQTQVGAESFQQSADRGENNDNRQRRSFIGVTEDNPVTGLVAGTPSQWLRSGNGLVDTFA